jgi:hypothetical protein
MTFGMCGVWCVVAVYLSVYVVKMWCFSVFCFVRVMRNIGIYCERYVSFPYYLYLPPPLHDPRSLLFSSSLPLLSVQFFIFPFLTSLSLNLPLILNLVSYIYVLFRKHLSPSPQNVEYRLHVQQSQYYQNIYSDGR